MTHVKICGIRSLEEARWAIEAGADALGFILISKSKRYIPPEEVQAITTQLPSSIYKVGVFAGEPPDHVAKISRQCVLNSIQLHGGEAVALYSKVPATKIKVYSFDPHSCSPEQERKNLENLDREIEKGLIQVILLDSKLEGQLGGTGVSLPWEDSHFQKLLIKIKNAGLPVILAGGLNPQNVLKAIELTQPFAVDVSSGVEREGQKDRELIFKFIQAVKNRKYNLKYEGSKNDE